MNRQHRLTGQRRFAAVRRCRCVGSANGIRVWIAGNNQSTARVGFAIPKAVGSAVSRNHIRRRLRAILAERLDHLVGCDVIVGVAPGTADRSFPELTAVTVAALESAQRQAGRIA